MNNAVEGDDAFRDTLDPARKSWVESANRTNADFPIQNLPFCVFSRGDQLPRIGVAIGDMICDVSALLKSGLLSGDAIRAGEACRERTMNALMALGRAPSRALRIQLSALLAQGAADAEGAVGVGTANHAANFPARVAVSSTLVPCADVTLHLPARIGDYTDFYASVHHATNVGSMFRPDNPLLPNYKWVPIGYHGRASSIVVSGTPVHRPVGQTRAPDAAVPTVAPSRSLDYELELGAWVGAENALGTAVPIAEAESHLFGVSLLNDWSARDLQAWEYQPLGPFLAKNFASTVSPFVVTLDALEPFRAPLAPRADGDPSPLPYLTGTNDQARGGVDLTLEVWLSTASMRAAGEEPVHVSRSNTLDLYWSLAQMFTHHASGGCNMQPGDLLGSGTVSGSTEGSQGCLLELTRRGAQRFALPNGESRAFLEDGDEVILRGYAERDGAVRIGLGECRGVVGA